MAFCNKLGGLLRQGVSQTKGFNGHLSMALLNSVRHMSSSKLFVGGLSWGTDENTLRETFASYGEVTEARVIIDRDTGRSRGFGFVSFASTEEASAALTAMDGKEVDGRNVRVNFATERAPGSGGGFGAGGGGGYRGGNSGYGGGDSY